MSGTTTGPGRRPARPKPPPLPPRPCDECGTPFVPRTRRGRYCSTACLVRATWRRHDPPRPPLPPQRCRYCGDVIDPKGRPARRRVRCDKRPCVDAYHVDWHRRRNADNAAGRTRPCAICGTPFPAPVGVRKKVCSPACERERCRRQSAAGYARAMADPDRHAQMMENHRDAEQRRLADPAYRERERKRGREQKRREYRRRAELDQLGDLDRLARSVGNDVGSAGG